MYHKSAPNTSTRKPVPVSGASDMQFGTEFFWYQFSVTNRTVLRFRAGLWYRFSGRPTGFRNQFLVGVSLALGLWLSSIHEWTGDSDDDDDEDKDEDDDDEGVLSCSPM